MFRLVAVYLSVLVLLSFTISTLAQDTAADPACSGAPAPRLVVGERGRVSPGQSNNLRDLPSRNGAKIGQIPAGGEFTVLEGPVCADGFNWWRVEFDDLTGWTVEGQDAEYWTEPIGADSGVPGSDTPVLVDNPYLTPLHPVANRLEVDARARLQSIDGEPLSLYAAPDTTADPIARIPNGTTVTLVEDGANGWWRVQLEDGSEGWLTEGFPSDVRGVSGFFPTIAPLCPFTEGRIIFAGLDRRLGNNLYTIGADGRGLCNLTYGAQLCYDEVAWSPDGKQLIFSATTATDFSCAALVRVADLYIMNADGSDLRPLTVGETINDLAWSPVPVEMPIAFFQWDAEHTNNQLFITDTTGSEKRLLTVIEQGGNGGVRWSPDGTQLAVIKTINPVDDFYQTIAVIDVESGEEREVFVSDWRVESLAWRPDGRALLASVYINVGQNVLLEIDVASGQTTIISEDRTDGAIYTLDGTGVVYWRLVNFTPRQIVYLNLETGEETTLATLPGVNGNALAWTPDGASLLASSDGVLMVDVAAQTFRRLFLHDMLTRSTPPLPQPVVSE